MLEKAYRRAMAIALIFVALLCACGGNPYEEKIKQTLEYIFTLPIEGLAQEADTLITGEPPRPVTQGEIFVTDLYRQKLEDNIGDLFAAGAMQRVWENVILIGGIYDSINGVGINRHDPIYAECTAYVQRVEATRYDENTYYFTCDWIILDGDEIKHQVEIKGRTQSKDDKISFFQLDGESMRIIRDLV